MGLAKNRVASPVGYYFIRQEKIVLFVMSCLELFLSHRLILMAQKI